MGKKKQLVKDNNANAGQKQLSNYPRGSGRNGVDKSKGKQVSHQSQVRVKNKRESEKYPGLKKNLFSKIKQEYHDYDYIDKLGPAEKEWLSKFTEENLGANLNPNKGAYAVKKNIHPPDFSKAIFDANNSRNRDIQSLSRVTGKLDHDNPELQLQALDEVDLIEQMDVCRDVEEFYSNNTLEPEDLPKFVEKTSKLIKT